MRFIFMLSYQIFNEYEKNSLLPHFYSRFNALIFPHPFILFLLMMMVVGGHAIWSFFCLIFYCALEYFDHKPNWMTVDRKIKFFVSLTISFSHKCPITSQAQNFEKKNSFFSCFWKRQQHTSCIKCECARKMCGEEEGCILYTWHAMPWYDKYNNNSNIFPPSAGVYQCIHITKRNESAWHRCYQQVGGILRIIYPFNSAWYELFILFYSIAIVGDSNFRILTLSY